MQNRHGGLQIRNLFLICMNSDAIGNDVGAILPLPEMLDAVAGRS